MLRLANAFSLNMLSSEKATIKVRKVSLEEAREILRTGFASCMGHEQTCSILEDLLGLPVPFNRETISLGKGDQLLVAQYRGPRLPEGATQLPEGATIEFFYVEVD